MEMSRALNSEFIEPDLQRLSRKLIHQTHLSGRPDYARFFDDAGLDASLKGKLRSASSFETQFEQRSMYRPCWARSPLLRDELWRSGSQVARSARKTGQHFQKRPSLTKISSILCSLRWRAWRSRRLVCSARSGMTIGTRQTVSRQRSARGLIR
jgi:hypothetical protein